MFKINWVITDNLENEGLEDFLLNCNGIYGFFSLTVNNELLGFCPADFSDGFEGDENILFWLTELEKMLERITRNEKYKMPLLSMNLCSIMFEKSDEVLVSLIDERENKPLWREKICFNELEAEVVNSRLIFINYIRQINPKLALALMNP